MNMNPFRDEYGDLRQPWYGVWSRYRDLANGLRGLAYWAPFAWKWRSWDYEFVLYAIEHGLKAMEPALRNGDSAEGEKRAQEVRVALELLRRLTGDTESTITSTEDWAAHLGAKVRAWDELFPLLHKKMRRWWQ